MATPLFDGQDIFGWAPEIRTFTRPARIQWIEFPGVNGRAGRRQGTSGGHSLATFTLTDPTPAGITVLEAIWQAYQQAADALVLRDTKGKDWTGVVLVEFGPTSPLLPANGGYLRSYVARFEHLI